MKVKLKMQIYSIKQIISNVVIGSLFNNSTIEEKRNAILISLINLIGVLNLVSFGIIALLNNNIILAYFDFFTGFILLIAQILLRIKKIFNSAINLGLIAISILFIFLFATGGNKNWTFLWYYTYPLIVNYTLGSKKGLFLSIVLLFIAIIIIIISPYIVFFVKYEQDLLIRFFPSFSVIIIFSYAFGRTKEKAQNKLSSKNLKLNETIAELRKYEDKLIKAREGLEKRVHERTATLARTNKQLKKEIEERKQLEAELIQAKKMETIGTLAGGVAHDLNNIVSAIINYPELLLLQIPNDSPYREKILTIKKSGEKVAAIVDDLLTLARRKVPVMKVLNLNDIISEYFKSPEYEKLESLYPNFSLELELQEDLSNIKGSQIHLSKMIMNLIANGIEAMPDGGKLTVSTSNKYIDSNVTGYEDIQDGEYVCIKIIDTGIGISKKDLNRIFEPFYTNKTMGRSGTGLGMSIVWGTVKDHKGYINAESEKEKGTTILICLPVTKTKNEINNEPSTKIEDYYGNNETVLLADDIEEQREIAKDMLTTLNYNVESVSSGEEAVAYIKRNPVDIILLDMIMENGIDGYETYKRILEINPAQKAIITSVFSETVRVKKAQALGAGAYIKKPYSLKTLGKTIKAELNY